MPVMNRTYYKGKQVLTSTTITKRETVTVPRGKLERWLSLPWRPWQLTREIEREVPSEEIILTDTLAVMHPATAARLEWMGQLELRD